MNVRPLDGYLIVQCITLVSFASIKSCIFTFVMYNQPRRRTINKDLCQLKFVGAAKAMKVRALRSALL